MNITLFAGDFVDIESKMDIVNNSIRKLHKLPNHRQCIALSRAARDHASYMANAHDNGYEDFAHRGGNGSPGTRAGLYGYNGVVRENIARSYTSVETVFDAWCKSAPHYATIVSDTVDVGYGYAIAKDGTRYWVCVYGTQSTE